MKQPFITLFGSVLILTLCGCVEMKFSQYNGESKTWPTGNSFTDKSYDLPVFRGWPEKAYDVLGYVEFNNPNIEWNDGDVKQAARKGKTMGGDALLMMANGDAFSPTLAKARSDLGITGRQTVAMVLKWK